MTINAPLPRKRYIANDAPSGDPITKAQMLAVRLTPSDKKTISRNSGSR